MMAVMTESPDADDSAALWTHWPLQIGVCVGSLLPTPCSRSVAEEKGSGLRADSVSADSAEGGKGRGEGGMPGCEKARQDPHSFGILARASGKKKRSNLSWFRSGGEYSNIYFCRARLCLLRRSARDQSFSVSKPQ